MTTLLLVLLILLLIAVHEDVAALLLILLVLLLLTGEGRSAEGNRHCHCHNCEQHACHTVSPPLVVECMPFSGHRVRIQQAWCPIPSDLFLIAISVAYAFYRNAGGASSLGQTVAE